MTLQDPSKSTPPRLFRRSKYGVDKLVLVQTCRIHYVEAGEGDPTLLIPGSYGTSRLWNLIMPLLSVTYRILALDYKRLSGPDKSERDFEQVVQAEADILAKMIVQMKLGKVNLVGGGTGGALAFDLAARYPELVNKVVSIGGYITRPEASSSTVKPSRFWQRSTQSSPGIIEEESKSIKSPILYMYGTRTNNREVPLAQNLKFLQNHLPLAWVISLEGGIFEIALKNPQEIADLIIHFFRINLEPRKA